MTRPPTASLPRMRPRHGGGIAIAAAVMAALLLAPALAAPRDENVPDKPNKKPKKLEDVMVPIPSYSPPVADNGCPLRAAPTEKPAGRRIIPFSELVRDAYGRYSVQLTVNRKKGREVFLQRIAEAGLSPDARTAAILYALRDHMGRDGLHTHFFLAGGALAPEIRDALKAAALEQEHMIYAAAMAAFGPEYPVDTEVREKRFGYIAGSELNAFDRSLLDIVRGFPDEAQLQGKIEAFIASRPQLWREIEVRRKSLGGVRRVDLLTQAMWNEIGTFKAAEISAATLPQLTADERALLAVDLFNTEFENGGIHQFFYNSSGNYAPDVADALDAIGLSRQAALVRKGMALFKAPYPRDRELRAKSYMGRRAGKGFEVELSELTDAFYALDGGTVVSHIGRSTQIEGGPGIRDGMQRFALERRLLPC